jgi:ABC-type phosphate/phosphonate transport system substrate-binding protein
VLLFGVFPHMPATRLFEVFSPVADDFSRVLGQPVKLRSKPEFAEFEQQLQAAVYDIALIQPLDYPWLHEKHGYIALARRAEPLRTVIIVARDSEVKSVGDLRGKTVAHASQRAAVTQITAAALRAEGLDPDRDVKRSFSRNHFSCMQKVLTGQAAACGTARRALAHWEEVKTPGSFRIIYTAPEMPHALFVVHPRVPERQRRELLRDILSWPDTESGREILSRGKLLPFVAASDADYDRVREFVFEVPNPE